MKLKDVTHTNVEHIEYFPGGRVVDIIDMPVWVYGAGDILFEMIVN